MTMLRPGRPAACRPRRLQRDAAAAGGAPAAAQPPHDDLHGADAGGVLPDLRAQRRRTPPRTAGHGNVSAFILISMALYGAMLATTTGGRHGLDRAGRGLEPAAAAHPAAPRWPTSRSRCSPPWCSVGCRCCRSTSSGLVTGRPSMPASLWVVTALAVWLGSLLFAAFGLFMGYLLPTENVMQILSFALMLFAFGGGLFVPLSQFPHGAADRGVVHPALRAQRAGPRAADG